MKFADVMNITKVNMMISKTTIAVMISFFLVWVVAMLWHAEQQNKANEWISENCITDTVNQEFICPDYEK